MRFVLARAIDRKLEHLQTFVWFVVHEPFNNVARILGFEMHSGLRGDQFSDSRIAKDLLELQGVGTLDDKVAVKFWMPDFHVLHAQGFAEFRKNSLAIDVKSKFPRVHKGGSHAGMVFAVLFQGDLPSGVGCLDMTVIPKIAIHIRCTDVIRQLLPDFVATGTEDLSKVGHKDMFPKWNEYARRIGRTAVGV